MSCGKTKICAVIFPLDPLCAALAQRAKVLGHNSSRKGPDNAMQASGAGVAPSHPSGSNRGRWLLPKTNTYLCVSRDILFSPEINKFDPSSVPTKELLLLLLHAGLTDIDKKSQEKS